MSKSIGPSSMAFLDIFISATLEGFRFGRSGGQVLALGAANRGPTRNLFCEASVTFNGPSSLNNC
jgi:hypothetical protein